MHWAALLKGCLKAFTWIWDMKEFQSCLGDKPVHRETASVPISQQRDTNLTRALSQGKLHTAGKPLAPAYSLPCLTIFSYWPGRGDWKAARGDSQLAPGCLTVFNPCNRDESRWRYFKGTRPVSFLLGVNFPVFAYCMKRWNVCPNQYELLVLCSKEGIWKTHGKNHLWSRNT